MAASGMDRRVTMADIARRAGVSTALVSIVMREVPGASSETRERVFRIAAEVGYRPDNRARLLRSISSRLLGVVFGVEHPFHGDLLSGLYQAAGAAGHQLALSAVTPARTEAAAVDDLLADRCGALILLGAEGSRGFLGALAERIPVVSVARQVRHTAVDVVRTADDRGLQLAVDHLVELGHRQIVHVDGGTAAGAAERRRGYQEAMHRHRLDIEIRFVAGGLTEDDGAAAAGALLAGAPFTAATVFNDRCATGFLDVLRRAGVRVPEDISVVGFDDSRLARLSFVNLTTIAQDTRLLSELAVGRAIELTHGGRHGAREQIVPPALVVRNTTAAAS